MREDDITVRAGDASSGPEGKITVTQAGAVLSVSGAQTVEATASLMDYTSAFSVTKGLSWNVSENMDWLTLTDTTDGTGNTTGENQEIPYSVVVNPNGSDRSGNITVKAGNAVNGMDAGLTKMITVTQAASVFSVTDGAATIPGGGGNTTGTVTATAGLAWTIAPETDNGITVSPTGGTGDATITFTGAANSGVERTGSFTLSATGASPARTLKITATQEEGETGVYVGNLQVCKTEVVDLMIWSEANSHCEGLTAEGKSDWYLPTKDELVTMYNNKSSLQGNADFTAFASGFYWSSTLYERGYPWCVSLSNGGSGTNYKIDRYSVRCVRTK